MSQQKERQLTGKIERSRIAMLDIPRAPEDVLEGFRALGDATCAVSDALDDMGLPGAIAGSTLRSIIPGARLVGSALTLRNEARPGDVATAARGKQNLMAETECHNLARPGDVLVIQGVHGASQHGRRRRLHGASDRASSVPSSTDSCGTSGTFARRGIPSGRPASRR